MTNLRAFIILSVLVVTCACTRKVARSSLEPWTPEQLIDPAELVNRLNNDSGIVIYGVSPDGMYNLPPGGGIKGAIVIRPTEDETYLSDLRTRLLKMGKDKEIVIYCGCCPFRDCPNIRPAFSLLNEMGFKNHTLLNLPHNIQEDWISKGYPMNY